MAMFLDDEIVELVLNTDLSDKERISVCLTQVRHLISERLRKNVTEESTKETIIADIKKVSALFDSAALKLRKKGIPILKEGAIYNHFKEELPSLNL
jgi:hypothetical protein